tara:strand:- start:228 stop:854 length:627 start_codon:yes stop_codon:yes gene_type:complete
MIFYFILISTCLIASNSKEILLDIYNKTDWELIDTIDNKNVLEVENTLNDDKYLMIESLIEDTKGLLNVIQSVTMYDEIISNKNVATKLLFSDKDTLYCLQKIKNSVPFIRDRQYIFKLYQVNNNRIDWYLINKDHPLFIEYLSDDIHTLTYGAGSWKIQEKYDKHILMYRMYVDEELNLPLVFIKKLRSNHALDIFNDVLNWSKGDR